MLGVKTATLRKIYGGTSIALTHRLSTTESAVRLAVLIFLLTGVVLISGCVGLTSAQGPSNHLNPGSGSNQNPGSGSNQNPGSGSNQNPGTSAPAKISLSQTSVDFGSVAIGSAVSQSIMVSNDGDSNLIIQQASIAARGFMIADASFPMTIGAGKQSTINIL